MNRLIKACEVLDIKLLQIQYNDFDDGDDEDAKIESTTTTASKLILSGMTCAACVSAIENCLHSMKGIAAVTVSLSLSRAVVVYDRDYVSVSEMVSAVRSAGYEAREGERSGQENLEMMEQKNDIQRLRSLFSQALTGSTSILMADSSSGYLPFSTKITSLATVLVALWVQVIIARGLHCSAWGRNMFRQPSMDTLISMSIMLGLIMAGLNVYMLDFQTAIRYASSGSFLITVVLGGRCIQRLLERQISKSFAQLYDLQVKTALTKVKRRTTCDNWEKIPALSLRPGDEIVLAPNSIVPCDCYVLSGVGMVDESSMTGESLPKACETGDFLMSGTLMLSSTVIAVVSSSQQDSALERLIDSVSTATETSPKSVVTDVLTARLVQIIILLAIFSLLNAIRSNTGSNLSRLYAAGDRAMAVLASACPCALGLASPTAVMSGLGVAWNKGIIFSGGISAIQRMANLTHIVMDKTGTLTTGVLSVAEVYGTVEDWQCMLICAAEKDHAQPHPVARAVFKWALSRLRVEQRSSQVDIAAFEQPHEFGDGIHYVLSVKDAVQQYEIHIGTKGFFQRHELQLEPSFESRSDTMMVNVAINRSHLCSLMLRDTIRTETGRVVDYLQGKLALNLAMLTGDKKIEADRVSGALNISTTSSQAMPEVKKAYIQLLQAESSQNRVAMVGDGINDTPALATADVGVLLSPGLSRSNRSCLQAADVVFTGSNLGSLVEAIVIAKMTERQVKFNQAWALLYNAIAIVTALGVFEPWGLRIQASMAGTLMAGSSISMIILSLLLRRNLEAVQFS